VKIERNRYRDFWGKCDLILILYRPRGTGDRCRRSQNGFHTQVSLITPIAVEFISLSPNIGVKKSKSRPRGTGDWHRRSQNGLNYTSTSLIMPSAEEFISSTLNIGAKKIEIKLTSNSLQKIESRGKPQS